MALRHSGGQRAAAFVFVTVLIDAMGIGIIIPVMPDLIRELTDLPLGAAALRGGCLSFVYALRRIVYGGSLPSSTARKQAFDAGPRRICSAEKIDRSMRRSADSCASGRIEHMREEEVRHMSRDSPSSSATSILRWRWRTCCQI